MTGPQFDELRQWMDVDSLADTVGITGDWRAAGAAAALAVTGWGGRYEFDRAGVETALTKWQQLLDDLIDDAKTARQITAIQGPGLEIASSGMADKARQHGAAFVDSNLSMQEYVAAYIEKLEKTRNDFLAQEQGQAVVAANKEKQLPR
jgi:hypothetical protein